MEVFQNLKLKVPPEEEAKFAEFLIKRSENLQWIHKTEFEDNYRKNTASHKDTIFCFESHEIEFNNKVLKAFLWIWKRNGYYEVFNIVPTKSGSLSYSEYNHILNVYYKEVLSDEIEKFGIGVIFSSPKSSIEDLIGDEAAQSLNRFSKNANKTTGNTNPFDFERWCEFVFIIHRNKIKLNIDDFVRWLEEEENWSNDIAWKLGLDLEYALNILEKYEQD